MSLFEERDLSLFKGTRDVSLLRRRGKSVSLFEGKMRGRCLFKGGGRKWSYTDNKGTCHDAGSLSIRLHHVKRVGAILHAGTVVAHLDLDDPSKVKRAQRTTQTLPQHTNQTGRGDKVHQVSTQNTQSGRNFPVNDVFMYLVGSSKGTLANRCSSMFYLGPLCSKLCL